MNTNIRDGFSAGGQVRIDLVRELAVAYAEETVGRQAALKIINSLV